MMRRFLLGALVGILLTIVCRGGDRRMLRSRWQAAESLPFPATAFIVLNLEGNIPEDAGSMMSKFRCFRPRHPRRSATLDS